MTSAVLSRMAVYFADSSLCCGPSGSFLMSRLRYEWAAWEPAFVCVVLVKNALKVKHGRR